MPLLILVALLAVPFLEVWAAYGLAALVGVWWTLAVLGVASAAGIAVLRFAGLRAYRDAEAALRTGQPPERGALDTLMLFAGGILLAIPGLLTGAAGLVLVLPVTRPALRWAFERWARRRIEQMQRAGTIVVQGDIVDRANGSPGQRAQGPHIIPGSVLRDTVLPDPGLPDEGPERGTA